jgi:hypothetical protein
MQRRHDARLSEERLGGLRACPRDPGRRFVRNLIAVGGRTETFTSQ